MGVRWTVLVAAACASCGGTQTPSHVARDASGRLSITVVTAGSNALDRAFRAPLELAVDVTVAELPPVPAEPADRAVEAALVTARRAYIDADFARCDTTLREDRVPRLLSEGDPGVAARWQFWRIACLTGEQAQPEAAEAARAFAAYQLAVPDAVDVATPEVEELLVASEQAAAAQPPIALTVQAASPLRVSVDGRARGCMTPCVLTVRPGAHVVAVEGDGFQPGWQAVRVDAPTTVTLTVAAAPPALAGRQWSAHFAGTPAAESEASLALLAGATRARTLVLAVADPSAGGRIRGALALDGRIAARAEVPSGDRAAHRLLRQLLVRAHLVDAGPPLYRRTGFWLAVGSATALAAGVTAVILFTPPTRTRLEFR